MDRRGNSIRAANDSRARTRGCLLRDFRPRPALGPWGVSALVCAVVHLQKYVRFPFVAFFCLPARCLAVVAGKGAHPLPKSGHGRAPPQRPRTAVFYRERGRNRAF